LQKLREVHPDKSGEGSGRFIKLRNAYSAVLAARGRAHNASNPVRKPNGLSAAELTKHYARLGLSADCSDADCHAGYQKRLGKLHVDKYGKHREQFIDLRYSYSVVLAIRGLAADLTRECAILGLPEDCSFNEQHKNYSLKLKELQTGKLFDKQFTELHRAYHAVMMNSIARMHVGL
jgi:hypothetical protein